MLENRMIIRAGVKRNKGSFLGIGILLLLAALSLTAVLMTVLAGNSYIQDEMERAGFGDLTAWASDVPDIEFLMESIREQEGVEAAEAQRLIFSEYEANGVESDSQGQMIPWTLSNSRYRFFQNNLSGYREAPEEIGEQEVYVSPSMKSMMDLEPGDTVTFPIARGGKTISLTVAGYYEDPFMGSSMIGMKGFLISEKTYEEIGSVIEETGMDALARDGFMIHIQAEDGITVSEVNRILVENTPLSMYTEFIHSADTMAGFMGILQNAFSAISAAFALVLFGVAMAVMGHSISGLVEQEWKNLGILKTMGYTGGRLMGLLTIQYGTAMGGGVILGMLLAVPAAGLISRMTVTTTGVLIPVHFPVLPCMGVFSILLLVPMSFCILRLRNIKRIAPMAAIRGEADILSVSETKFFRNGIRSGGLSFHLALRQVLTGRRRYAGACLVAVFLVFFANVITEPKRFHISRGQTSMESDQVVLTEALASDLGADVGDFVTIRGNKGSGEFMVSGIYHCANDMGANLGMSREGYLSIGEDDSRLWCYHYFLEDPSQKQAITEALEHTWGGDVHVHENSWPGLFGIISAMHMLILFLYGVSAAFICVVTGMAGTKILDAEQKDMGIYKSIGCSVRMLRCSFAFRFGIAAGVGAVIGTLAAMGFTDPVVSTVMRLVGISNFASGNTPGSVLLPGSMVILLFFGFAWLLSGRIRSPKGYLYGHTARAKERRT